MCSKKKGRSVFIYSYQEKASISCEIKKNVASWCGTKG